MNAYHMIAVIAASVVFGYLALGSAGPGLDSPLPMLFMIMAIGLAIIAGTLIR